MSRTSFTTNPLAGGETTILLWRHNDSLSASSAPGSWPERSARRHVWSAPGWPSLTGVFLVMFWVVFDVF